MWLKERSVTIRQIGANVEGPREGISRLKICLQEPVPIEVCLELAMPSKANGIHLSPKNNQKYRQHLHYWKLYGLTL